MRALILAMLLAVCASPALALDATRALSQYRYQSWTSDDGLPANYVNAVVHGRDGYLWLGTEEGLARFDGIRFTVFDRRNTPAFRDHNVQTLHEDQTGTLWIGTRAGGLVRYRDGAFSAVTTQDGLTSDRILAIASTPDGVLWIATTGGGVNRYANGRVTAFTTREGLSSDNAVSIAVDARGTVWAGTTAGGIDRLAGTRFEHVAPPGRLDTTVAIATARDGSIWFGSRTGGLWRLDDGRTDPVDAGAGLRTDRIMSLLEDRDGSMWVGTNGRGVVRVAGGRGDRYTAADGLAGDIAVSLGEDRDGSVWVGTGGAGLVQIRDSRFTPFGRPEGLSHDIALATLEDRRGALWIGTHGGGLNRLAGGRSSTAGPASLADAIIYSLLEDARGDIWVGTGDAGVVQLTGAGTPVTHQTGSGLASDAVYALLEDERGVIWAGTRGGLSRFESGRWTTLGERDGLGNPFVRALARGRDGAVWVGTNGGGVSRIKDGRVETFKAEDNLSNFVRAVYEDSEGYVWVGTSGGGLNLLRDGRFLALNTDRGLPDDVVYAIVDDGRGSFWMSSNRGIVQVARQELLTAAANPGARINASQFGTADGMRSAEANGGFQPAATRGRDGRIWFPTIRGVVTVDPASKAAAARPPQVVVERVVVNRTAVREGEARSPVGAGEIEVTYTGLSFRDPARLRFQYRLDSFDSDWVDAGTRRTAYYTNLPPGRYSFRVRTVTTDGVRSVADAVFALQLQPRFYQTGLFASLVVFGVALALMGAYRWRLRVLRELQSDLMRLVHERTEQLEDANRQLAQLSYIDALTEIANRRALEQELTIEWRRSARTKSSLSMLMVDIDGFKAFNDALGHQAGDECLKKVAQAITQSAGRAADTVARYGGEEFAVLLPDTDTAGAAALAERIRAAVELRNIPHPAMPRGHVTVSIGVATMTGGEAVDPATLVHTADKALYQAKGDGRNLVRIARNGAI